MQDEMIEGIDVSESHGNVDWMRQEITMRIRSTICAFTLLLMVSGGPRAFGQGAGSAQSTEPPSFGTWKIGAKSAPIPITLKNPAKSKVKFTITPDKDSKPDFQIEKNECEADVSEGASCVVEITFSPRASGARASTWQVSYKADSDAKDVSYGKWELKGTGILPDLTISSSHLLFQTSQVSSVGTPQTITLSNNSQKNITISKIYTTGDFTLELPTTPQPLKPNESVVVAVSFNAKNEGNVTGMLTIVSDASESPQDVMLSGSTGGALAGLCAVSHCEETAFIFVLCLLYWLGMVTVRWQRIARGTRELLRTEITSLQAKLGTLGTGHSEIAGLLDAAKSLIDPTKLGFLHKTADFLFWSRGQEMGGWGYVHEAEVQMAEILEPETVKARLEIMEQRLRITNDAGLLALANTIHQELTVQPQTNINIHRCRPLLAEALNAILGREDNKFADLVSWQNKASWLVGSGLLLILALTYAMPQHSILFLVGAAGGLISRLARSLDRKDVPTDYGASWTTMFLSPVSGALGAWAGILIAGLAVQLNVLGSAFNQAKWDAPCQPTTLAIALLFGFSERLLDSVMDKLEGKAGGDKAAATVPQPAQNPVPPPNGPNPGGAALTIPDQPQVNGTVGQNYNSKLRATGNVGNVAWSRQAGSSLPPGLQLGADGQITGIPTAAGSTTFTVVATDQNTNATANKSFTITIT